MLHQSEKPKASGDQIRKVKLSRNGRGAIEKGINEGKDKIEWREKIGAEAKKKGSPKQMQKGNVEQGEETKKKKNRFYLHQWKCPPYQSQ